MADINYYKDLESRDDIANTLSRYFEKEVNKVTNKINFNPTNMYYIILSNTYDEIKKNDGLALDTMLKVNDIKNSYDYQETVQAIKLLHDKNLISDETRNTLVKNYIVDKITKNFSDKLRQYLNKALEGEEW